MLGNLFGGSRGAGAQTQTPDVQKTKLNLSHIKSEGDKEVILNINREFVNSVLTDQISGFTMPFEKEVHVTPISYTLYYYFPYDAQRDSQQADAPARFASPFTMDVSKLILLWQKPKFKTQISGVRISAKGVEFTIAKTESVARSSRNDHDDIEEDDEGERISARRKVIGKRNVAPTAVNADPIKMRRRSLDVHRNMPDVEEEDEDDTARHQHKKRKRVDEDLGNVKMTNSTKALLSGKFTFGS